MTPKELSSNMLWFFPEDSVEGQGKKIQGPAVVRVDEYPDVNEVTFQAGDIRVTVSASSVQEVFTSLEGGEEASSAQDTPE